MSSSRSGGRPPSGTRPCRPRSSRLSRPSRRPSCGGGGAGWPWIPRSSPRSSDCWGGGGSSPPPRPWRWGSEKRPALRRRRSPWRWSPRGGSGRSWIACARGPGRTGGRPHASSGARCGPTRRGASRGSRPWPNSASGPASPTTWGSGRPSRCWPSSSSGPSGGPETLAPPWSCAPRPSWETGSARSSGSRRASPWSATTGRPGPPPRISSRSAGPGPWSSPPTASSAGTPRCSVPCRGRPWCWTKLRTSRTRGPARPGPRAPRAAHRVALTGTPVENRLAELWSILEFATPGLLGSLEAFRRTYAVPIERYQDTEASDRLRRVVGPFILRRLKSDPAVIRDLPAKNEMRVVCTLTKEQATLYQAAVTDALRAIEESGGIQRRGRVLALMTALKQICDHPALYLGERGPLPGRSGKLARLQEMLEEVVASGDRALVFTQFREMGERLVAHLGQVLQTDVLFLHGGTSRSARDAMVRRFQEGGRGPQVFVL